jgi:hypothetical protein
MATGPYINVKLLPRPPLSQPVQMRPYRKRTTKCLTFLSALILALLHLYLKPTGAITKTALVLSPVDWQPTRHHSDIRIAEVTILYDGANSLLTSALELHEKQEYEVHVLRQPIVKGFADQLLWLQEVIVKEMRRPSETRMGWIL